MQTKNIILQNFVHLNKPNIQCIEKSQFPFFCRGRGARVCEGGGGGNVPSPTLKNVTNPYVSIMNQRKYEINLFSFHN